MRSVGLLVLIVCVVAAVCVTSVDASPQHTQSCLTVEGVSLIRTFDGSNAAAERVISDLRSRFVPCVRDAITVDSISDNQFSALVSVAYNLGCHVIMNSRLAEVINSGSAATADGASVAADKLLRLTSAVGKNVVRARAEVALFNAAESSPCADLNPPNVNTHSAAAPPPAPAPVASTSTAATAATAPAAATAARPVFVNTLVSTPAAATAVARTATAGTATATPNTAAAPKRAAATTATARGLAAHTQASGSAPVSLLDLITKSRTGAVVRGTASGTGTIKAKGGSEIPIWLPPPPEWGPLPATMYTEYWHRPKYSPLSTANHFPLYTKTSEEDTSLPASMTRRASFAQQVMYDNYITPEWIKSHGGTHSSITDMPHLGLETPRWFGNSVVAGGLGEYYARQLINADGNHNHFPLYSSSTDHYTSPGVSRGPTWMGGSPAAAFNEESAQLRSNRPAQQQRFASGGVFLQTAEAAQARRRASTTHVSTTRYLSSPKPVFRSRRR